MKIISKFKDYYDFLIGKYGIDSKIILYRTKRISDIYVKNELKNFGIEYYDDFDFRILVVCGKYYLLIAKKGTDKTTNYRLVIEKDLEDEFILLNTRRILPIKSSYPFGRKKEKIRKTVSEHLLGVFNESLVKISKEINQPIFTIVISSSTNKEICIDKYFPNLSKIKGFTSVYPPENLYNDISFFIGNVLNNDIDPEKLKISDKDQIVKKGFDLKTSFRGRNK